MSSDHSDRWSKIYLLMLAGLCIRISFALSSDNIYHPDELFQYLEQAHRLVFGYGYIPWEYRFGIRSWMTPGFIAIWLFLCKVLGLDNPSIYIPLVKFVLCLLSISVIFCSYIIGKNLVSESAGRLAAFFSCLWYELIYFAHKPLPDVLSANLFMGALASAVAKGVRHRSILFGLLSAFCIAIRPQLLPAVGILVLFVFSVWKREELLKAGFTFSLIIGFAGYIDFLMWGSFFASYYNNFLFNTVYGVSNIFGTKPLLWYFSTLTITSMGMFIASMALSFIKLPKVWLLFCCVCVILVAHSIIAHKEYRFVFTTVPLLLIITAILISEVISGYINAQKQMISYIIVVLCFVGISATALSYRLPRLGIIYPTIPLYAKSDHLRAYRYLAREPDLEGVLDASKPWWETGGYYYLHHDIPVYFPRLIPLYDKVNHYLRIESTDSHGITDYVSHIVCPTAMEDISGFRVVAKIGRLEIRKQINPPHQYKKLDFYSREMFFNSIDGRYTPTVQRRF